jgi:hypothetical protein
MTHPPATQKESRLTVLCDRCVAHPARSGISDSLAIPSCYSRFLSTKNLSGNDLCRKRINDGGARGGAEHDRGRGRDLIDAAVADRNSCAHRWLHRA